MNTSIHPMSVISGAGLSGALVVVLAWGLSLKGIQLPGEVAGALSVVFSTAIGYVFHNYGNNSDMTTPTVTAEAPK